MEHATPEFGVQFTKLKEEVAKDGFVVLEGFDWQQECSLYVLLLDCPMTLELFMELAEAAKAGMKILGCAEEGSKVSPSIEASNVFNRFERYRKNSMVEDILVAIVMILGE